MSLRFTPPSDAELEHAARQFLQKKRLQISRVMSREETDGFVRLKVAGTKRLAEQFIFSGLGAREAWGKAIRLAIEESTTD